ncbi:MAG: hypothetical protein K2H34_01680, partial [Lachnospiraceae bacterium]|nr:hypothetical protein [Lachnospiraceae bacterium]
MKKRKIYWQLAAFSLVLLLVLTMIVKPVAYAKSNKSGTSVTKITVKTTGTMLNEGQVLTKSMLKKSLKVTARLKNGKTRKKYAAYNSKQIGKTIEPISKGKNKNKYKVVILADSAKKTVYVKVNRIKKIYFKNPNPKTLTEGAVFDVEAFKKDYTVYADYKKGAGKEITTYTVSAPDVVKADANGKFDVTVKYGKNTATITIPVTKPATEEAATESSTTEDTVQENPTPGQPTVGEDPKPEQPTPEVPAVEEVDWLYYWDDSIEGIYNIRPEDLCVYIHLGMDLPDDYTGVEWWGIVFTEKNIDDNLLI